MLNIRIFFCFLLFTFFSPNLFSQFLNRDTLVNYSYIVNGRDSAKFQTSGTGSIMHFNDKYFLVTNYHVLTAKDVNTNKVFPDFKDSNTAVSIIFQPLDGKSKFIVNIYPLYDVYGNPNFATFKFQNQIIDIAVMPILIPKTAAIFAFNLSDIDTTEHYLPKQQLIMFGFPKGQFKNSWQPTELNAYSIENYQKGKYIYDPFVFFNATPISGMSGSPVYYYDSEKHLKVLSVASNQVDFNPKTP